MLGSRLNRKEPESKATSIVRVGARYFMRVWLCFTVLVGTPIFVGTLRDVVTGGHHMSGDKWVGLMVFPALVLFGTVLPKFGRLLGKSDERFMLEHIRTTLAARIEEPESQRG
jgi:hypothetical protein